MDLRYRRPVINIPIPLVKQGLSSLGVSTYQRLRISASQRIYATKRDFKRFHNLNATTIRFLSDVSMLWKARKDLNPRSIVVQD